MTKDFSDKTWDYSHIIGPNTLKRANGKKLHSSIWMKVLKANREECDFAFISGQQPTRAKIIKGFAK